MFFFIFFFFKDTATTAIYTLSLHDALPICLYTQSQCDSLGYREFPGNIGIELELRHAVDGVSAEVSERSECRSEEHTSELQSPVHLVCRLLLEKKKKINKFNI